jgi:acetolactate synthase-1/2/3 large subunit
MILGRNYPVDVAVVGDARAALRELVAQMPPLGTRTARDDDALHSLKRMTPRYLAADGLASDAAPMKPQRLVRELREAMPEDGMLFVDNGTAIIWGTHYFEARRPNTFFIHLGLSSMGSAVAGVVGGALAAPRRTAVALVGDGAFAMNGSEVHTAVEQGVPVVWIVLNNSGLGMVYQGETLMKGVTFGTSRYRVPIDAAAMGRALGARGVRVGTPLEFRRALEDALKADVPTVIDALVDPAELVPTLVRRAQTLAGFMAPRRTEPPVALAS